MATPDAVHIHPADNVCIATQPLASGSKVAVNGRAVKLTGDVKLGHKIALAAIPVGQRIIRYGHSIGVATEPIAPGDWVHSHNLAAGALNQEYEYCTEVPAPPAPIEGRTFQGYRRADGRAGTRNYIAVISSVNCSASVSKYVARRFDAASLAAYPNVDGVLPLVHQTGRGLQYGGVAHESLSRVLGGMARHPNIGAYILVGLGCETGTIGFLLDHQRLVQ